MGKTPKSMPPKSAKTVRIFMPAMFKDVADERMDWRPFYTSEWRSMWTRTRYRRERLRVSASRSPAEKERDSARE